MYITDLDNTLLGKTGLLSDYSREHLKHLIQDVDITFATARSLFTSGVVLDFVEFKLPFIVLNGAGIVNRNKEYVYKVPIFEKTFRTILELTDVNPMVVGLKDGHEVLLHKDVQNEHQEKFLTSRLKFNDPRQMFVEEYPKVEVLCLVMIGDKNQILSLEQKIKGLDDINYFVHINRYGTFYVMDIMSKDATKGNAVKRLTEMLGKDISKVHTFGDDFNDVSMLEVTIPHMMEESNIEGYPVVGDNGDDAVVRFIERNELKFTKIDTLDFNLDELVEDSRKEDFNFVRRLRDEYKSGYNNFKQEGEVLYLAHIGSRVVGSCGLNKDPYLPSKPYGRIRHMYVLEKFRGRGISKELLKHVVIEAKKSFPVVTLRTFNEVAHGLYTGFGFKRSDLIPYATNYMILEDGYEIN